MMLHNNEPLVLIAFASKHGATAGIARHIGNRLEEYGIQSEVDPVRDVKNLCRYDAVIFGSAVYFGKWRDEAIRFIKKHKHELSTKPVWIFSSGPTGEGDAIELVNGVKFPPRLASVMKEINPEDITVFHGAVDKKTLGFIERWIVKRIEAPTGDFRDWEAVDTWVDTITEFFNEPSHKETELLTA